MSKRVSVLESFATFWKVLERLERSGNILERVKKTRKCSRTF